MSSSNDLVDYHMSLAVDEAKKAFKINEVQIGAVIVFNDEVIGRGYNQVVKSNSISSHAEINAINEAGMRLQNYRLINCDLFVTVEPCYMCCMAIIHSRISRLFFASKQPKTGAVTSIDNFLENPQHNHKVNYTCLGEFEDSSKLLVKFFKDRR